MIAERTPLLSLTQSWLLLFLVTARRDCAEESLASISHMRASPSVRETPQQISSSSSPFSKTLRTVQSTPTIISITLTLTLVFHCIFSSLARPKYLSLFSLYFFHFVVCRDFFSPDIVVWPGYGDLFVSQNRREFFASHSSVCAYTI